mgnify:CR=1 FL=1
MPFTSLGLGDDLLAAVADQGYHTPSPIQAQAIPAVLSGRDVMAAAQTGTGKTAGFTLPLLERLRAESTVIELSDEERAKWMAAAQRASDAYITSLDEQGLPGTETYEALKGYVSECEAELN